MICAHRFGWFCGTIVLHLLGNLNANAAIIRVDHQSTTNGPGNLTNWSNAFNNLESALDDAEPGDVIWVADGLYLPTERTNPTDPTSVVFRMREGVAVLGGFQGLSRPGGGENAEGQRNPMAHETILSGDIDQDGHDFDNADTVVLAVGEAITDLCRLNGFTIRDAWGRGITVGSGAWPVIAQCVIFNNGGGMVVDNAVPGVVLAPPEGPARLLSCRFADNHSTYHGGGAFVLSGSASFVNCVAHDNTCVTSGSFTYNAADYAEYINCTIVENSTDTDSDSGGGAINCGSGETVIVGCIIRDNVCGDPVDDSEGAQISTPSLGTLSVRHCDIQGLDAFTGNDNFDADPLFVNPTAGDHRLEYLSVALNSGDPSAMPADSYDIDSDGDTAEALPARDMADRMPGPSGCIDVGAFENQTAESCVADITGGVNDGPDGQVGDPDLDLVLDAWGTAGGVADIEPFPCGDGRVNVDDLLLVLNSWGPCSTGFNPSFMAAMAPDVVTQLLAFALDHPEHQAVIESVIEQLMSH